MKAKELKRLLSNIDDNTEIIIKANSMNPLRQYYGVGETTHTETIDHQGKLHASLMLVGR